MDESRQASDGSCTSAETKKKNIIVCHVVLKNEFITFEIFCEIPIPATLPVILLQPVPILCHKM